MLVTTERIPDAPEDKPDWRNKDHYTFMIGFKPSGANADDDRDRARKGFKARNDELAWQFLRRNGDYIDAWQRQQEVEQDNPSELAEFVRGIAGRFALSPKYRLRDPRLHLPAPLFSVNDVPRSRLLRINTGSGFGPERRPLSDDQFDPAIDFRFYLGASFDEQVKHLKKHFVRQERKLSSGYGNPYAKPHRRNLVEYCRVLDGLEAGAKPTEISDTLWGNAENRMKKFYQHKSRAENLVAGEYVGLLGFM